MKELIVLLLICLSFCLGALTNYHDSKYDNLEDAINIVKDKNYVKDTYDCDDFSYDFQYELEDRGIGSSIITGYKPDGTYHTIVGVWIEPQTGKLVDPKDFSTELINIKCD